MALHSRFAAVLAGLPAALPAASTLVPPTDGASRDETPLMVPTAAGLAVWNDGLG